MISCLGDGVWQDIVVFPGYPLTPLGTGRASRLLGENRRVVEEPDRIHHWPSASSDRGPGARVCGRGERLPDGWSGVLSTRLVVSWSGAGVEDDGGGDLCP